MPNETDILRSALTLRDRAKTIAAEVQLLVSGGYHDPGYPAAVAKRAGELAQAAEAHAEAVERADAEL